MSFFDLPGAAPNDLDSWIRQFQPPQPQQDYPRGSNIPPEARFFDGGSTASPSMPAAVVVAPPAAQRAQLATQNEQFVSGPDEPPTATREAAEMTAKLPPTSEMDDWATEDYLDPLMPTPILENYSDSRAATSAEAAIASVGEAANPTTPPQQERNDYSSPTMTSQEMVQQLEFLRRQQLAMTEQLLHVIQSTPGMPNDDGSSGSAASNAVVSTTPPAPIASPSSLEGQQQALVSPPRSAALDSPPAPIGEALNSPHQESGTDMALKKIKDPLKPKRPLTAYNIYFREQRAKMLAALPGQEVDESSSASRVYALDTGQSPVVGHRKRKRKPHGVGFQKMAKIIGAQWQELDEEGRAKYKRMAHEDSLRYRKEMEEYYARRRYQEG